MERSWSGVVVEIHALIAEYMHELLSRMARTVQPDSKVHEANMGPIWGRQSRDGPYVGPMNFAVWEALRPYVGTSRNEIIKSVL